MRRRNKQLHQETLAKRTLRSLRLEEQSDSYGVPVGVLAGNRRYTVLVTIADRTGASTIDDFARELPTWSAWLRTLGLDDRICGASLALQTWRQGTPRGIVGLTFTSEPRPGVDSRVLGGTAMLEEISTHLGRVLDGLRVQAAGFDVEVCTSQDVVDLVRACVDSSIAQDVELARTTPAGTGLVWADAAPRPESTGAAFYSHDRVTSTSWAVAARDDEDLPRLDYGAALRGVPESLCSRVTVIHRIYPSLEAQLRPVGAVVTVDVGSLEQLVAAQELPAHQTLHARLRLRAATHTQDAAFLAGLPLDLATPHTAMIPRDLKESA